MDHPVIKYAILGLVLLLIVGKLVAFALRRERFEASFPLGPSGYILIAMILVLFIAVRFNVPHRSWLLLPFGLVLVAYYGMRVWTFFRDTDDAPHIRRAWWKKLWDR